MTSLRATLSELGGALVETERRRLATKLRRIESDRQQMLERLGVRGH